LGTSIEADDVQTLILNGYRHLEGACFLRLRFGDPARACRFLSELEDRVNTGDSNPDRAVHVAFTHRGLAALGLDAEILASFSRPFREGMSRRHRRRVLGDVGENDPRHWDWGYSPGSEGPGWVDALVLVYATTDAGATAAAQEMSDLPGAESIRFDALATPGSLIRDGVPGEHFGFVDSIANPALRGTRSDASATAIAPGEILLGYPNEAGLLSESPHMTAGAGGSGSLPRGDFGRNGSYLVVRQLEQRVGAFWSYLFQGRERAEAVRLAAKMVGRWPNGAPLARWPEREPPARRDQGDDFGYASDPDGLRCPIGAHVRRANPRDSVPLVDGAEASLRITRRRRILRRGRSYGAAVPGWPDPAKMRAANAPDGARGMHFLCFNANIESQFEFIQQSWLNARKFAGMANDADPLVANRDWPANGGPNDFTIPERGGLHRLRMLPQFVRMRGGAYCFMPGRRTLRYLARLR